MKRVLFVPGRTHYLHDADYPSLLKAIDAKDYDSRFVPIKWEGTTLVDWTEQLSAEYDKCDPDNTVLAGFSMGAMAAFIIAANAPKKPQGLWLGSLSPYFAEDLPTANPQWRADQTPEHLAVLAETTFSKLVGGITCKTVLLMGEQESLNMSARFCEARQAIADCQATVVTGVGHDITHPAYIDAISAMI